MQSEVRAPVVDDADAMGNVHVRAWQAAYRGVMPDDYLDELRPQDRSAMWQRQIKANGGSGLLVSVVDGVVVGFAAFGRCSDDSDLGELYAINLDPDVWGEGLGRALLAAVTAELCSMGFRELVLWTVPENQRARNLYESAGWVADGASRDEDVLGVTVRDVRYRSLSEK